MSLPASPPPAHTLATRRWVVPVLITVAVLALAVRIGAFFWLPNIDGDAYCYLDKARELRTAILSGSLRVQDLFYFWLPLYPLAVSVVSLVVPGGGHLMLVGKLISAASGLAACWFVYRLVCAMTRRPLVALVGALCVALDPWQLLYSANTMTELPFEALALAALDRVIARRWTAAAVILACAGLLRIEAWPLAAFVPAAAYLAERKIKIAPVLLVFVAPAIWLTISYATMGDPRAFFTIRNAYVADYLAHNPTQAHLTLAGVQAAWSNLRQGACLPILLGACAGVSRLVIGWCDRRAPLPNRFAATAVAVVFVFLLTFLLAAYVTHSQPVIWVRYGLIYVPLGVCLTLWWLMEGVGPRTRRVAAAVLGICVLAHVAFEYNVVNDTRGNLLFQQQAAALLTSLHPRNVFCDSIVVRVEAGLTPGNSCDSFGLRHDRAGFLEDLRTRNVDYLVFIDSEASTPVNLFPSPPPARLAPGIELVQKIDSPDWRPPVLIYHVSPSQNDD